MAHGRLQDIHSSGSDAGEAEVYDDEHVEHIRVRSANCIYLSKSSMVEVCAFVIAHKA